MQSLARAGDPVDTKGYIKTSRPLEDLVFAPGQAGRVCPARDVALRGMDSLLTLQAERPKQHQQRDVKQKGLKIPSCSPPINGKTECAVGDTS